MPPSSVLTRSDAAHFLRRIGFGGTEAEIQHFTGRTRLQAVTEAMNFADAPDVVAPPVYGHGNQWEKWVTAYEWWVTRMRDTIKPLQEKMTLFWHGHFCSEQWKVDDMGAMFDQNNLFRTQGLGNFHSLAQAVSIGPAMLVYLDNATNRVGAEQENFARELMELFTLGVGNYTEGDVVAMAKAWTGHNSVGWNGSFYDPTYVFRENRHDNTNKTLFGITRNWNGPEALTEIVNGSKRPQCARFIARKMYRFFANATPADATVQYLADQFTASNMDIATLLREILLHEDFWGEKSRYALVKSPIEFVVSLLRRVPVPVANAGLTWSMQSMGQILYNPPNVAGWGQNGYWLSTATAWGRGQWLAGMRWRLADLGYWATLKDQSAADAVSTIFSDLGIVDPSPNTRSQLQSWFTSMKSSASWAIQPNALIMGGTCPDFQLA